MDDYEIQKGETLLCLDWWWVGRKDRKVDINEEVVCIDAHLDNYWDCKVSVLVFLKNFHKC